jgi:hypothetical protein
MHLAATYDGSTMRIYVNGLLDNSATTAITINTNALALGVGGQSNGDPARIFSGAIDDARVYGRALSANEIAALAIVPAATYTITASAGSGGSISPSGAVVVNAGASQTFSITPDGGYHVADVLVDAVSVGAVTSYTFTNVSANRAIVAAFAADTGPADLVGWWRLDGGVADASTYGNNGSLPNGGSWVTGVESQALSLNGSSQYVSVPHSASLNLTSAVTLAAWIRPTKLATQPVIAKEAYATSTWGYALELSSVAPGRAFFRLDGNAAGTSRLDAVTAYPQDGTAWMHLAATFDGATMRLYVNGVLDASQTHAVSIPQNTQPLAIGSQSLLETGRLFSGAVDEVRVYSRALSAAEIQTLMNHTITASAAAHGAISPAGAVSVAHGGNQTFDITPDPGYLVADVQVDGFTVGAVTSHSFTNVTQSHTIAAAFTANVPPIQPTLAAPADLATDVALSPTLDVGVVDPDSPQLTVNFYGRATNGPPGPDFTVVVLPDAQNYPNETGGSSNAMYKAQTQWCVNQLVGRGISYVAMLGDCVEDASVQIQWMRADTVFKILEDPGTTGLAAGIPYGIAVGNHDQDPKSNPDNSTQNYNQWFGAARFQGRGYYGGHFADNNDTWFQLFSASGMDFIVLGLEYDPSPDTNRLSWADSLLKAHPSRRAIVVSHSIIGPGNPGSWDGPGLTIYNALKSNPNLFLMLCGHVGDQGRRQDVYNGHTVHSLLSDYQGWSNGGDGWLRYMEFSPANNVIRVRTYTPWLDQYKVTADSSSQFTLPYDMSGTSAYQLIGTATNVASGAHATMAWPNLVPGTQYEWYVSVTDGAGTTTSTPAWRFTTASSGTPPDAVADLGAAPAAGGNDGSGRTRIALTWSGAEPGATAHVYRKAYGDYPAFREGLGAAPAPPESPAAADAAGWTPVAGVTTSGQTDQPPVRDCWYYVLFLTGAGGTSPVSNLAGGTLDYLLGDVSDGASACAGNNTVNTADVSLLGARYGMTISAPDDPYACLDVGPTVDGSPLGRPRPDGAVEFEDLVLFAMNFTGPGGPGPIAARAAPLAAAVDALELQVPARPRVGDEFDVIVRAQGKGDVRAVSLTLAYDRSVVEMVGAVAGELLSRQAARSVVLSPKPGRVDLALLGSAAGLGGEGELARVTFRVKETGEPAIAIAQVDARDAENRRVALGGAHGPTAPRVPGATQLGPSRPNPFTHATTILFDLAARGPVDLALFGVDGRRVRTLVREVREPGEYAVEWNGRDDSGKAAPAGVYFARLVTAQGGFTRPVTYLK